MPVVYELRTHPLGDALIRLNEDGTTTSIPFSEENSDYEEYLAWLAEGNTPEPWPPAE